MIRCLPAFVDFFVGKFLLTPVPFCLIQCAQGVLGLGSLLRRCCKCGGADQSEGKGEQEFWIHW